MRKVLVSLCLILAMAFGFEAFAKRGGFSSGGSRSYKSSSPRRSSSPSRRSSTPRRARPSKPRTPKVKHTRSKVKANSKMDKKMAKKDKAAANKYGTKKKASQAYKKDLVNKNKYNSPTAPSKRPEHIPQNVTINNQVTKVSYGGFAGGGYGYGYYHNGIFMALAMDHMLMDATRMRMAGYGHWDAHGHPIYYQSSAGIVAGVVIGIIIVIIIVGVAVTIKD